MKEYPQPQDVITTHQQVQKLRVTNAKPTNENEKLTKSNEEVTATIQHQMVMDLL